MSLHSSTYNLCAAVVLSCFCCVLKLLQPADRRQSSNVKLFVAQRIRETAKPLKFLELMKATCDCGGNTRQRSAGVRRHERNSLDPRKDDFLKFMMQS